MTECKHHWIVDSPNGHVSRGICKNCNLNKDFYNSDPDIKKTPSYNNRTNTTIMTPNVKNYCTWLTESR